MLIVVPTAIAARVLNEFSRHELEGYCRRKNRPGFFDEVLDHHEEFAIGAEAVQWFGTVCFLVSTSLWFFAANPTRFEESWLDLQKASDEGLGIFLMPSSIQLSIWILSLAVLLVLINSWVPWSIAKIASAPFLFHTWGLWRLVNRIAFPMAIGFAAIQFLAHRMAGKDDDDEDAEEEALEEEIRTIVTAGEREGLLESPAREMIEGVINLDDIDVGEIMTPRSKMNALDINLDSQELIRKAIDFGHTRIPIFEKELENIIGILFVKDLLSGLIDENSRKSKDIRGFLRPPQFVPISIRSDDLLQQFRESHSHLSIVIDEYESVVGVVTIEDVLEEIVGDITDETDSQEESELVRIDGKTADVLASIRIDELNQHLKVDLPDTDDFDTLAGLVLTKFGRIPKPGESMVEGNVRICVQQASNRKIERLRLEIIEENRNES
ncbi:MAG: hemolysin family protein [Planctomycetota bacterium]|nr:hemolysin family protein [Planctomycetota bacterium]